jgi:hypothetical protein
MRKILYAALTYHSDHGVAGQLRAASAAGAVPVS